MTDISIQVIDAARVASLLEEGGATLLDVLVPEHFTARHIPGSRHACVYDMDFLEQVERLGLSKGALIVPYGAGGGSRESLVAAEKLARDGFTNLLVFAGGLEEWVTAGHPLEGEAADVVQPPHPELVFHKDQYALVAAESSLIWTGRNNNGRHVGVLPVTEGVLTRSGETLAGSFVLDMANLENTDLEGDELKPVLEAHLKSDDFFFVSMFPTARFEVKTLTPIEGAAATSANVTVNGQLTMRGVQKDIVFDAQLRPDGEGRLVFMGKLELDRTQWGVIYGSARFFAHLGYHAVHDDISVEFRLILE